MKLLLSLVIGVCLMASALGAGHGKRIAAIEQKFGLKFVEEVKGMTHVWMFVEPAAVVPGFKMLAIATPIDATDKEVSAAKVAAEFACGWFVGALKQQERETQRPSPVLPPEI